MRGAKARRTTFLDNLPTDSVQKYKNFKSFFHQNVYQT